ncbi:hypothetical protein [uncultured Corynebacterium sp.]|uniref:hypothetical protein n=1 Tax=uncultured Corynebacterium sp. TaxID=159447 RepID=UPI0025CF09A2|nr:hypothetical protein [uncultured Corynebacterium sp.]
MHRIRTIALTAATCGVLVLTACGGDEDASPTTVESPGAVTGDLPRFDTTAAIRDTLAGTDRECAQWRDVDEGLASCVLPGGAGIHGIYLRDDPTTVAATVFGGGSSPAVVIGNNWLFDCGPSGLDTGACGQVADILGGTVVLPDPV